MFNMEKFITAVQAKPTLWKYDDKSYNNRFKRRQAWEEIAQQVTENWDGYSERKRDDIIDELQKKWRNIRDYHIKLRKKRKVLNRKASYLNLLGFLDTNLDSKGQRKRRASETDDDSEDDYDGHVSTASHSMAEANFEIPEENVMESDAFQNSVLGTVTNMHEDPDRSFLISILPDIKTMNEKQKFKFKLETLKLIDKIKYPKISETMEQKFDISKERYGLGEVDVLGGLPQDSN